MRGQTAHIRRASAYTVVIFFFFHFIFFFFFFFWGGEGGEGAAALEMLQWRFWLKKKKKKEKSRIDCSHSSRRRHLLYWEILSLSHNSAGRNRNSSKIQGLCPENFTRENIAAIPVTDWLPATTMRGISGAHSCRGDIWEPAWRISSAPSMLWQLVSSRSLTAKDAASKVSPV